MATQLFRWMTRRGLVVGSSSTGEFSPTMAEDFFTGMSPGQAAAGVRQLGRLAANLRHRREVGGAYQRRLAEIGGLAVKAVDRGIVAAGGRL